MKTQSPGTLTLTAAAVLSVALLAGCEEKETTTVGSPPGSTATTTTTTTVAPTPNANTAMNSVGDAAADAAITAKVKTAFLADTDVKGLQIDVDTKDGVVTLNGSDAGNVDKAVSIARGIEGVKSVQSNLTAGGKGTMTGSAMDSTKDAANKTGNAMANAADKTGNAMSNAADKTGSMLGDAAITAKVKSALLADPDVKGLKVDVDTKDNIVTLSGTLDNHAFADKAESIAKGIDGVKSVNNKLAHK